MDMSIESGWLRAALLLAIFLLVAIGVMIASAVVGRRLTIYRRVAETMHEDVHGGSATLRTDATRNIWTDLIDTLEKRGLSLSDTQEGSLRARLIAAGYTSPYAPRWYTLIRLVLALGLPIILVGLLLLSSEPPSVFRLYILGAIAGLCGLYLPNIWVAIHGNNRADQIRRGFPDALDLMLVCVEAGLGMEAACDRVGREMSISYPLVSQMLAGLVLEMRAGRSREEALRRMADRVQIEEIKAFTTLLIQSDKLGSSMGQSLRTYAAEMREKRRMRAEEKAHRLPVIMSIPLVVCMLPVMIGVLMLPAVIRVLHHLLPTAGGG